MSLLYDRALVSRNVAPGFKPEMEKAVIIAAEDCAEYYWSHFEDGGQWDDSITAKGMINLAPPFEQPFWIEFKSKAPDLEDIARTWGFLFTSRELDPSPPEGQPRWRVEVRAVREIEKGDCDGPYSCLVFDVLSDGTPVDAPVITETWDPLEHVPEEKQHSSPVEGLTEGFIQWLRLEKKNTFTEADLQAQAIKVIKITHPNGRPPTELEALRTRANIVKETLGYLRHSDKARKTATGYEINPETLKAADPYTKAHTRLPDPIHIFAAFQVHAALFAVSLMHCKNVTLKITDPIPALSKKHERRKGRKLTRYHILHIEPMKAVLKTEGRSGEVGLTKALHLCRGHFKDYREKGLFGKYPGVYWWGQTLRGSADNGTIIKSYTVNKPKTEPILVGGPT